MGEMLKHSENILLLLVCSCLVEGAQKHKGLTCFVHLFRVRRREAASGLLGFIRTQTPTSLKRFPELSDLPPPYGSSNRNRSGA